MAVVGKKRKKFTTYYVVTWFQGAAYNEPAGTDKREAQRLDRQRKAEVKAGTFRPNQKSALPTVAEYAATWCDARTNVSASDDRRNVRRFLSLPEFANLKLEEVRPRHILAALAELKGTVALKTLQNAYGALRTMFRDARIAEFVSVDPCVLPRSYFATEDSKEREAYTRTETAVLLAHHGIPEPIRVLLALCLLAGMREGEACGRRWRDLDQQPEPLWALDVGTQYGGRALKTKKRRVAPVHPDLRAILERWGAVGFVQLTGRIPMPDDYIVPNVSRRAKVPHHTKSSFYKQFRKALVATGIPNKTLHSTRHTMITLARRGGGDKAVVSKVTHNAKGDIVDRYTHRDWAELCAAVLAIGSISAAPTPPSPPDLSARPSLHLTGKTAQETASDSALAISRIPAKLPIAGHLAPSSIPGASTEFAQKLSSASEARQSTRPSESAYFGGLPRSGDTRLSAAAWGLVFAARGLGLIGGAG